MLTIEYGTNNKDEKGKIIYTTDITDKDELKRQILQIKELYQYMVKEQQVSRMLNALDNRP